LPDDIDTLVPVVLPHRLIPMRGVTSAEDVMQRIVAETPVPAGAVQPS
jgi:MoxR-like ATPase